MVVFDLLSCGMSVARVSCRGDSFCCLDLSEFREARHHLFGDRLHVVERLLIGRADILAQDELIHTGFLIDRQLVDEIVTRADQKVLFQFL